MNNFGDRVLLEDEGGGGVVVDISKGHLVAYRLGYVDDRIPKIKVENSLMDQNGQLYLKFMKDVF